MSLPQDVEFPNVETLRERIPSGARAILDYCWVRYATSGEPASKRELNHEFGTHNVEAATKQLPRGLIRSPIMGDAYTVSFLGALITSEGSNLEQLTERYINALKASYLADHTRTGFALSELSAHGDFSEAEITRLGRLLTVGITIAGAHVSGSSQGSGWHVSLWEDAESVRWIDDPKSYVRALAVEQATHETSPVFPHDSIASFLEPGAGKQLMDEPLDLSIVLDDRLRAICERDWRDATRSLRYGIAKGAVILGGAIAEALLLGVIENLPTALVANALEHLGIRDRSLERLTLDQLTKLAAQLKLISGARVHLTHALREHRNLVHPVRERNEPVEVNQATAEVALAAVRSLAAELRTRVAP